MASIFRRVTRYPVSVEIDPRENRLTETFASVLERVDGLAAALVGEWTGVMPVEKAWIRTQRPTVSGKFVDLEVGFGSVLAPNRRIWIEVKHGATLHHQQLESYVSDLAVELQDQTELVLLAPRDSMPTTDQARSIDWQRVSAFIRRWQRDVDDPVAKWLLEELLTYLKEEGLVDEDALNPAHAFALAARPSTDRTVARLVEFAQQVVESEWGQAKKSSKQGGAGWIWYATFPLEIMGEGASSKWRTAWPEWTLREDDFRPDTRDAHAFFAGMSFQSLKESPLGIEGNEAWLAARMAEGFERVQSWYWRLWRPIYPEQLMAETSLEAQGRKLGEWVAESFRLLAASPPAA